MTNKNTRIPSFSFICLMAGLMSLTAMSIDSILPALGLIRVEYNVDLQNGHWIITSLFIGLTIGQLFFGTLSDTIGRKLTVYLGILIFVFGNLISFLAETYTILILGRLLQGFGAAAPKIVSQAIIKDLFSGPLMAQVMSFVMTIFIIVPVIAPLIGQSIIWLVSWYYIFIILAFLSIFICFWFSISVPETLKKSLPFGLKELTFAFFAICRNQTSLIYMLDSGFIFGGLISFLNVAQPLYQNVFGVGDHFPFYFAFTALLIGLSSFINTKIISKIGAKTIVTYALLWIWCWSALFMIIERYLTDLGLIGFLLFSALVFTAFGFLFGNINAIALNPMGHIAGNASAIIGTSTNIIAVTIGAISNSYFQSDSLSLIVTFFLIATINLFIVFRAGELWLKPHFTM